MAQKESNVNVFIRLLMQSTRDQLDHSSPQSAVCILSTGRLSNLWFLLPHENACVHVPILCFKLKASFWFLGILRKWWGGGGAAAPCCFGGKGRVESFTDHCNPGGRCALEVSVQASLFSRLGVRTDLCPVTMHKQRGGL